MVEEITPRSDKEQAVGHTDELGNALRTQAFFENKLSEVFKSIELNESNSKQFPKASLLLEQIFGRPLERSTSAEPPAKISDKPVSTNLKQDIGDLSSSDLATRDQASRNLTAAIGQDKQDPAKGLHQVAETLKEINRDNPNLLKDREVKQRLDMAIEPYERSAGGPSLAKTLDKVRNREEPLNHADLAAISGYPKTAGAAAQERAVLEAVKDVAKSGGLSLHTSESDFDQHIAELKDFSTSTVKLDNAKQQTEYAMGGGITNADLSNFAEFPNLKWLDLSQASAVSDLTGLKDLQNLKTLNLHNSAVSDLTPLKSMQSLENLFLSQHVGDLAPLKDLKNLKTLNMNDTEVNELNPLKDLRSLESLHMSNTQVRDLAPLKDMQSLKQLGLAGTQVSDLTSLKDLKNLEDLDISGTQVNNLTALKEMSNLGVLDAHNSKISDADLQPLKHMPRLWMADFRDTAVSKQAAAALQKTLKALGNNVLATLDLDSSLQ